MKTEEIKDALNAYLNLQGLKLKCWLLRLTTKKFVIRFNGKYQPELGGVYVKRGVSCEYIGKNRWLPLAEDFSIKLSLGARIKAHYYNGKQNTLIIRKGKVIAHL